MTVLHEMPILAGIDKTADFLYNPFALEEFRQALFSSNFQICAAPFQQSHVMAAQAVRKDEGFFEESCSGSAVRALHRGARPA